ncbi:TetR family transcriptional regulator [Actinoplanes sp. NPDC024001]|uniref:TetR/AcrR family transcriptional regulator n=1 Tax=Actinoplanes sp. NPDC024001 TaxID=3154598 RepID=UPI0033DC416B
MSAMPVPLLRRALQEAAMLDPAPAGGDDPVRERILTAAAEQFRLVGIRRSSMDDVARRAGVSRITVYRRFAGKTALVEQLLLGELRAYVARFRAAVAAQTTAADRLVEGFVAALQAARDNRLVGGLLAADPDVLVPLLTTEGGAVLGAVREFLADRLREEQAAGDIPASVDTRMVAEVVARLALSFFVTPDSHLDLDDPGQVRAFARRTLGSRPPKWCMTRIFRDERGGHRRSFGLSEDHEGETCDGRNREFERR